MSQYNYISGKLVQSAPAASVALPREEDLLNPVHFGRKIRNKSNNQFITWALILYDGMTVSAGGNLYVWNGGIAEKDNSNLNLTREENPGLTIGPNGWKKVGGSRPLTDNVSIDYNSGYDGYPDTDDDELEVMEVNGGSWNTSEEPKE